MSAPSFNDRTDRFLQWFKNLPGAALSDSIEIADLRSRNAGRGMVATRDIAADATLFTIPRRAIVNVHTSKLCEHLPHLFESQGDGDDEQGLDSWGALILILMYEHLQGESSAWKPYLDVLPETFDTPMFWSDDELSNLQGGALQQRIGKADAEGMFRAKLLPAIRSNPGVFHSSGHYSDEHLIQLAHRMGSTIMAYAFDLESDADDEDDEDGWVEDHEGKSLMGMVPMADILNADAEFNAHVNHGDDSLTVTSLRPIKAGEEILNYYGPHPNSELLRRYGYVTEKHSRYDVVEIPWRVVEDALMSHLRVGQATMEKARIDGDELEDTFVLERESGEPNFDGTFTGPASVAEIPADLQEQLKTFLKALQKIDGGLVPDKRKRDDLQRAILTDTILAIELRYTTSISADHGLLQQTLSQRHRMAVQVRLGEKRLLEEAKVCLSVSADDASGGPSPPSKKTKRDA
ncbi:Ribosomal lysine N-methyltransferase 4 [Tolypocladium capitatum]|uniref:Ribosomal lysine N-methyltransferase 4 n=1 Tax=Tolypocladium capitatum TaxID=45235 RepID=A0A2K3QN61_9HYPO|nr:Ribosomal lysine N-methyltransferase 4 [Tolypocladium capitatum]